MSLSVRSSVYQPRFPANHSTWRMPYCRSSSVSQPRFPANHSESWKSILLTVSVSQPRFPANHSTWRMPYCRSSSVSQPRFPANHSESWKSILLTGSVSQPRFPANHSTPHRRLQLPRRVSQPRFPANHSTSEAIPAGLRERTTASDLILAQAQFEPEPQHFLDLPHGQFFRRQCRFLLFPEEPRLPDSCPASLALTLVGVNPTSLLVVLLRGGVETRKLRAEPNDRFLSVPPVAHPLAVTHALLGGYGRAFAIPCCVGVSIGRPCSSPSITCGNPPAATRWATRCLFSGID